MLELSEDLQIESCNRRGLILVVSSNLAPADYSFEWQIPKGISREERPIPVAFQSSFSLLKRRINNHIVCQRIISHWKIEIEGRGGVSVHVCAYDSVNMFQNPSNDLKFCSSILYIRNGFTVLIEHFVFPSTIFHESQSYITMKSTEHLNIQRRSITSFFLHSL